MTDNEFYRQDEKIEISKHLLSELADGCTLYRMLYNDWTRGVTPDTHPDMNAVQYLLGENERVIELGRALLQKDES